MRTWNQGLGQAPLASPFWRRWRSCARPAGAPSGAAILTLIAVFYTALNGAGRRSLYIVLGAVAVFYLAPILLVGPAPSQYRAACSPWPSAR